MKATRWFLVFFYLTSSYLSYGQQYFVNECLPIKSNNDSLCMVLSDIDASDVNYVVCLNKSDYPIDFIEDTTIFTFEISAAFEAEKKLNTAQITFLNIRIVAKKDKNTLQYISNKPEPHLYDSLITEFNRIMSEAQYCFYITSPKTYNYYERKFNFYINIRFIPRKNE